MVGVKNGRKYFGRLSKGGWVPLSTLVELFKNLNDGTGRSKYLHNEKQQIIFITFFQLRWKRFYRITIIFKYISFFFFFFSSRSHRKSKSLDKFIYEWTNKRNFVDYKRYVIINLNEINEKLPNISFTNLYPFIILFNPSENLSFFFPLFYFCTSIDRPASHCFPLRFSETEKTLAVVFIALERRERDRERDEPVKKEGKWGKAKGIESSKGKANETRCSSR